MVKGNYTYLTQPASNIIFHFIYSTNIYLNIENFIWVENVQAEFHSEFMQPPSSQYLGYVLNGTSKRSLLQKRYQADESNEDVCERSFETDQWDFVHV